MTPSRLHTSRLPLRQFCPTSRLYASRHPLRKFCKLMALCLLSISGVSAFAQDSRLEGADTYASEVPAVQDSSLGPGTPGLRVDNPDRAFGYVIGDVLVQRIYLPADIGPVDLSDIEDAARVSTWLERQSAQQSAAQRTPQDSDSAPTLLTLRYQIINSPDSVTHAALPELSLRPASDTAQATSPTAPALSVAAWPFTLGPLTAHKLLDVGLSDAALPSDAVAPELTMLMQADARLPVLDVETPARWLLINLLLLLLSLSGGLIWLLWRSRRDRVRLPFARAASALRRHPERDGDAGWKLLHHAFNQSTGFAVTSDSVDVLLATNPWMQPLEERIRSFYELSAARYFELPPRQIPFAVPALAHELARHEKRHSS